MMHVMRDGGFAMYLTLVFGLMLLGAAVRYSISPERRWVPLLLALGTATVSSGACGFVTGLIMTMHAVIRENSLPPLQRALISAEGFAESLNNVAFSLVFVLLAALMACVGAWRLTRMRSPGEAASV